MMTIFRIKLSFFVVAGLLLLLCSSCSKEDAYLEKRAGPYKIVKVVNEFYHNFSNSPDSVYTYESDTLGYFNFYNGTPANIYVVINYPSLFLTKDFSARYEVHEKNHSQLVISILRGSNWVDTRFTVTDYNKRKQEWLTVSNDYAGNITNERIWVEKQ